MRYYHMIVQYPGDRDGSTRREYISNHQGSAPPGYICVGVCGFHDKPREVQYPCRNCVYFDDCGHHNRTEPCGRRKTRKESKGWD